MNEEKSYIEKLSIEVLADLAKLIDSAEDALSDLAPGYNSEEAEKDHFGKILQSMWDDIGEMQSGMHELIGDIQRTIQMKTYIREIKDLAYLLDRDNPQILLGLSRDDLRALRCALSSLEVFHTALVKERQMSEANDDE